MFNKEEYWKRRKLGIRGQGPSPTKIFTPKPTIVTDKAGNSVSRRVRRKAIRQFVKNYRRQSDGRQV